MLLIEQISNIEFALAPNSEAIKFPPLLIAFFLQAEAASINIISIIREGYLFRIMEAFNGLEV